MIEALARSRFRASFKLDRKDIEYIDRVGLEKIEAHARDFVSKRLAPAHPENDGRQTPFRGHPVFKAQHATATCCRGCFEKWYHIPAARELSPEEIDAAVDVIMEWVELQYSRKG